MDKLAEGESYTEVFSYSQEKVKGFAELSGDYNPLHLDEAYAAKTVFKRPIIHGFLGSSIFSKILGTQFPGEGTVYLKQELDFKRPMYVEQEYEATLTIKETDSKKHTAIITTTIKDTATGKVTIAGQATVLNKNKL